MTKEEMLTLIRECIDEIKEHEQSQENLSVNDRQHLKRAIHEYTVLYDEAERGRVDADMLHENISSFLYVIQ